MIEIINSISVYPQIKYGKIGKAFNAMVIDKREKING